MFRFAGDLLSPAGERGKLGILIYHRALAAPDPILHDEIDAATFERQMTVLAAEFNVLPLSEACARLERRALPARAVCVTFDDGYADNEQVALPILQRLRLPATFFVATGYSAGGCMFNDGVIEAVRSAAAGTYDLSRLGLGVIGLQDATSRRDAVARIIDALKYRPGGERHDAVETLVCALGLRLPSGLMMTPAQISKLSRAGMEIGAHTVHHPILACVDDEEAREEIVGSKRALEEITGSPVTMFAYPNGKPGRDYGPQHVRFVREAGFKAAVSTINGIAHRGSDLFQLPRYMPWERNPRRLAVRLLLACARAAPMRAAKRTVQPVEVRTPRTGSETP
jgi:peptidoglycan/xylan/chitin deacetylase (PgdA/CDA1 family)